MANDRQQPIVLNHLKVDADVTYQPILLTRVHFDDEVVDPSGSNAARSDGGDLRFYKNDDQTGEIARDNTDFEHDSVTGAGDAAIEQWVGESSFINSSVSDTTFYVEYGDGALTEYAFTATFGRNNVYGKYSAVWHLNDTVDSTGNGFTLTEIGSPSVVSASYGKGYDLNGSSQRLDFSSAPETAVPMTHTAFAKSDSLTAEQVVLSLTETSTSNNEFKLTFRGDQPGDFIRASTKVTTSTSDAQTNAAYTTSAYHLAGGRFVTATDRNASIDGANEGQNTTSRVPTGIDGGSIGALRRATPIVYFDGIIEEARIAGSDLGLSWLKTEYNNQSDPATFATAGTPVPIGGVNNLLADDVESSSEVTTPVIAQVHQLIPNNVESTSETSNPAIAQVHSILADDVESNSETTAPALAQVHQLTPNNIESASEVSNPALAQVIPLFADDVESATEVSTPALAQVHQLIPNDAESNSEVTTPVVAQIHQLFSTSVESNSEVSNPALSIGDIWPKNINNVKIKSIEQIEIFDQTVQIKVKSKTSEITIRLIS